MNRQEMLMEIAGRLSQCCLHDSQQLRDLVFYRMHLFSDGELQDLLESETDWNAFGDYLVRTYENTNCISLNGHWWFADCREDLDGSDFIEMRRFAGCGCHWVRREGKERVFFNRGEWRNGDAGKNNGKSGQPA